MKIASLMIAAALFAPTLAAAEPSAPPAAESPNMKDARLVPTMKDGAVIGLKVYAIKPGGRFDQIGFQAGDLIESVDGIAVTTDDGSRVLHDRVIAGKQDATVSLQRKGAKVELRAKAIR